jgi:hypothetical protein
LFFLIADSFAEKSMEHLFTIYEDLSLDRLADKLNNDFYQPIREKCKQVAAELVIDDSKEAMSRIVILIEAKQESLLSYLRTLAEKSGTGHNCSNCSGQCDMGHAEHLMGIKESHIMIGSYVTGIDMNELPGELQQLSNLIADLVRVEEQVLVPKIWNAQKKINAIN